MRKFGLILTSLLLVGTAISAAQAAPMRPDEARRFVAGKLFSYTCFDGTRGVGRIYADGAVVGTLQPPGKPARFVAMPVGTVRISSTSICASLRGALFEPCFEVVQTSRTSFRGSVSGLGFAYCDFVRRDPRVELSEGARTAPVKLRPTATGSATTQTAPAVVPATPHPVIVPPKPAAALESLRPEKPAVALEKIAPEPPLAALEKLAPPTPAEVAGPVQSAVVTFE